MNRKYTTEEYEEALNILRTVYEHPALTTDVIAGFVRDNEEEFEKTRAYLEKDHLYEMHILSILYEKEQEHRRCPGMCRNR